MPLERIRTSKGPPRGGKRKSDGPEEGGGTEEGRGREPGFVPDCLFAGNRCWIKASRFAGRSGDRLLCRISIAIARNLVGPPASSADYEALCAGEDRFVSAVRVPASPILLRMCRTSAMTRATLDRATANVICSWDREE